MIKPMYSGRAPTKTSCAVIILHKWNWRAPKVDYALYDEMRKLISTIGNVALIAVFNFYSVLPER